MANRITVSALSPAPPRAERGMGEETALRRMIDHWSRALDEVLPDRPDFIVLPEMCDRYEGHGREQAVAYYHHRGTRIVEFFEGVARENRCCIACSALREMPDGSWRNSTQVIDRSGSVAGVYDKNHVMVEETTDYGILCGKGSRVIPCDFGQVSCAICFDLNFDEILDLTRGNRPDVVAFSSMYHGGLMQRYWAYRCRAYFVAAVGSPNPCTIIDPLGETVAQSGNYVRHVTARINLDRCVAHLDYNEERLAALKREHGRGVTISTPAYLGSVLISSETDGTSAREMAERFSIELLDDYFARARDHRRKNLEP